MPHLIITEQTVLVQSFFFVKQMNRGSSNFSAILRQQYQLCSSKMPNGLSFSNMNALLLKPRPFMHLFSTSNFTSTLLNSFVLEHSVFKTKQLRSVVVKLLVLNWCLDDQGFRLMIKDLIDFDHQLMNWMSWWMNSLND